MHARWSWGVLEHRYRYLRSPVGPASCTGISISIIAFCAVILALSLVTATATDPDTQIFNTVYVRWGSPEQLASWDASSGKTACNMTGVHCDSQARVVSLSLYNIPTGMLHPLLFSLTSLTSLTLVQVNLIGVIPAQMSQLIGLQRLKLSNNFLIGSLPLTLSLLTNLTSLEMNSNQFTGPIPQELSTLAFLRQLQLGNNMCFGPLPVAFSSLTALDTFYAPFNNLSSSIPPQFSALQQLTILALDSNRLDGGIPEQLTSIRNLSLSVNGNLAMCGSPLIYGPQANSNIGQDCPGPEQSVAAAVFQCLAIIFGPFLVAVAVALCACNCPRIIQERAARAYHAAAQRAIRPIVPAAFVHPHTFIQIQQLQQQSKTCTSEYSSFFSPE